MENNPIWMPLKEYELRKAWMEEISVQQREKMAYFVDVATNAIRFWIKQAHQ